MSEEPSSPRFVEDIIPSSSSISLVRPTKRSRGRPRKYPTPELSDSFARQSLPTKRPRGRPKKLPGFELGLHSSSGPSVRTSSSSSSSSAHLPSDNQTDSSAAEAALLVPTFSPFPPPSPFPARTAHTDSCPSTTIPVSATTLDYLTNAICVNTNPYEDSESQGFGLDGLRTDGEEEEQMKGEGKEGGESKMDETDLQEMEPRDEQKSPAAFSPTLSSPDGTARYSVGLPVKKRRGRPPKSSNRGNPVASDPASDSPSSLPTPPREPMGEPSYKEDLGGEEEGLERTNEAASPCSNTSSGVYNCRKDTGRKEEFDDSPGSLRSISGKQQEGDEQEGLDLEPNDRWK